MTGGPEVLKVEWTGGVRWGEWEMLEELGGGRKGRNWKGREMSRSSPLYLSPPTFPFPVATGLPTGNGQAVSIITSIVPFLYQCTCTF